MLVEDERILNWAITLSSFSMEIFTGFISNETKHPEHSLHETSTEKNGLILMLGQASQTPVNAGLSTGFLSIPTFSKDMI